MDYELAPHAEPEQRLDAGERPTRVLHVMLRVFNLQRSLDFYVGALGMRLLRRQDHPGSRQSLVFLGYGAEDDSTVLELAHSWDRTEPYSVGTGYGHVALAVGDIYATCADLAEAGLALAREPAAMRHGKTVTACIEDPDGYRIELIAGS